MGTQDKVLDGAGLAVVNQIIGDKLDKKQDKLSAGDGTTVAGNKVNVNTPVQGIYTQAEYDALPEEQKNKGMYVIPDAGGGSESGSSGEIYSTEETRIGTWIDGRPVYRTVIIATTGNTINTLNQVADAPPNIDFIVKIFGNAIIQSYQYFIPCSAIDVGVDSGKIIVVPRFSGWTNFPSTYIVEYTKTTDTAPTQEVAE